MSGQLTVTTWLGVARVVVLSLVAVGVWSCARPPADEQPECACSEGQVCVEGVCRTECDVSADACMVGQVCLEGICVAEFRCASDAECPGGRCVDGGCYALECEEGDSRPCSSECGEGMETCSSGVWRTCDAPIPRIELCGNGDDDDCDGQVDEDCSGCTDGQERECETACATGVATCVGGQWQACAEEGECQPDEVIEEECGACGGVQSRVCSASCQWQAPGECVVPEDAQCAPGASESRSCMTDGIQMRYCQQSCTWGAWGRCLL